MPRGGRRKGTPGKLYPNRTDLSADTQPVRAPSGQPYGQRGAQEAAQQAIPLPQVAPIDAPTARPDEPLTAGLSQGPGPGPEILGAGFTEPHIDELRALYQAYPNPDLLRLIEEL